MCNCNGTGFNGWTCEIVWVEVYSCISRVMADAHTRACRTITEAWLANYVASGSNVTFLIGTVGYTSCTPRSRIVGFKFVAHRLWGARAGSLLRITGPAAIHRHSRRNILFLNWIDQFKPLVINLGRSEFIQLSTQLNINDLVPLLQISDSRVWLRLGFNS